MMPGRLPDGRRCRGLGTLIMNRMIQAPLLALALGCSGFLALPAQAAGPTEHVVRVVSDLEAFRMYFSPKHLRIAPGDRVTWVNEQAVDHNVMSYPDGFPAGAARFESPFMSEAGETWSQTFTHAGLYEYHCVPHLIMGMHGSVRVGDPTVETAFHEPSADEVKAYRNQLLEYFDQEDLETLQRPTRSDD